jgi:branched-chain amino acid transport system substrate-binding protein
MCLSKSKSFLLIVVMLMVVGMIGGCAQTAATPSTAASANVATSAAVTTSADGTANANVKTIKVGMLLPLSGSNAPLGLMSKNACEIAVQEVNDSGGIKSMGGAKIEFVYADSQGDPQVGVSETERLITVEKVDLMDGAYQSGVTLPATEVSERYKKIWLDDSACNDTITERGFKYLFRTCETASMRAMFQLKYMKELIDKTGTECKTVAMLYENTAYGQGFHDAWLKYLPGTGLTSVVEEAYDAKAADLSPVVTKTIAAKPDIVLLCSYVNDAALLIKGFAQQQFHPKAFVGSSSGFMDPSLITMCGDDMVNYFDMGGVMTLKGAAELEAKFQKQFGYEMSFDAMMSYGGVWTIKEALEAAGTTETEALREAFVKLDVTTGPLTTYTPHMYFDEKGQFPEPPLALFQFQKDSSGKIVRACIYPTVYATGGFTPVFPAYGK